MDKPLVLFIESNTSGTGRLFMHSALKKGYTPILLTVDPSRYSYIDKDGFRTYQVDTNDKRSLLDICNKIAETQKIIGITSSSEYFISTAAYLAHKLFLPAPKYSAIDRCRDKWKQRAKLQDANIDIPKFYVANNEEEAISASKKIGLPVVVKPTHGSGSIGVRLCRNDDDLKEHALFLLSRTHNERGIPIEQKILIEEFIDGVEFSVETFDRSIIGVTKKYTGELPYFIEIGHDFPALISIDLEREITSIALKAIEALDLCWGANHIELSLFMDRVLIIEVNPRLAGGNIPKLVNLSLGIDLIDESINLITGGDVSLSTEQKSFSAIRFLLRKNRKKDVTFREEDLEEIIDKPGIIEVELYDNQIQKRKLYGDFRDRFGHVIIKMKTAKEVFKALDSIEYFLSYQK